MMEISQAHVMGLSDYSVERLSKLTAFPKSRSWNVVRNKSVIAFSPTRAKLLGPRS